MNIDNVAIGKKIRALRQAKSISIATLAVNSGMSPDYLFRIEHGDAKNIGIQKLSSLAAQLNFPLQKLIIEGTKPA